jgi:DNA invertase Pin-like site-specific DNA recombinase
MEFAHVGETIAVRRLDRRPRSLRHLIDLADSLDRRGISVRSLLTVMVSLRRSGVPG